jgi:hypothetical protein
MSFSEDVRDVRKRFPQHVQAFETLFKKHGIHSVSTAWNALPSRAFRQDFVGVAEPILKADGGKLTLGVMFAIIGAALGGVGIAAMGGAIGVPLALIGALVGLVLGNEVDAEGYTSTFIRKLKAFRNG